MSVKNTLEGEKTKHRWRLRHAKLEDAGKMFEHARARFEHALVLGQAECYTFENRECPQTP